MRSLTVQRLNDESCVSPGLLVRLGQNPALLGLSDGHLEIPLDTHHPHLHLDLSPGALPASQHLQIPEILPRQNIGMVTLIIGKDCKDPVIWKIHLFGYFNHSLAQNHLL